MDFDRLAVLLESFPAPPSRRSAIQLVAALIMGGGLALDVAAADAHDATLRCRKIANKQRRQTCFKAAKKHNAGHRKAGSPPPTLATVVCPGPFTTSFTGARRFAQTFTAPRAGFLVFVQVELSGLGGGEDFTVEIRTLTATGTPSAVLATTTVLDAPATPSAQTYPLLATFATPPPVRAGGSYAVVVTAGAGQAYIIRGLNNNTACPGQGFIDSFASGTFSSIPGELIFATGIFA